jgi:hypothetical protein
MKRQAIGRFVPEVQSLIRSDVALAEEVVSVVLNDHFPDSIHEDILGASHLEQLQTAKPKRDSKFRQEVLRVYGYRCVICGFDLRLDNALRHDACYSGEARKEVLVSFSSDRMKAWPISPRVNSPANNDPEIMAPVEV